VTGDSVVKSFSAAMDTVGMLRFDLSPGNESGGQASRYKAYFGDIQKVLVEYQAGGYNGDSS
jgi:hypothetical protein